MPAPAADAAILFQRIFRPCEHRFDRRRIARQQSRVAEATMMTGELLRDLDGRFQPGRQWRLEVTDEARELIYLIWLTGQQVK
jgi:hypothetical protein